MNKALLVFLVGVGVLAAFSVFTVDERELVIKLQLGRIVRADYETGLKFKVPFVQNVIKFDRRIQNLDSDPELFLTSEKKNVKVDSFVKWRIKDVTRFYTAVGGSVRIANDRLSVLIQKRLKDEFGKRTVEDVVSGERAAIMDILTLTSDELSKRTKPGQAVEPSADNAAETAAEDDTARFTAKEQALADLGIEIVDVRIKRIDLPEEVSNSVYQRMSAERKEVAKDFRSQGEKVARTIRAAADREREVILASAERDGQRLRGEGDGTSAEIYAKAYNKDREFFTFYRSLDAYRTTFSNRSDLLLLEPDTEFFKYFKDSGAKP